MVILNDSIPDLVFTEIYIIFWLSNGLEEFFKRGLQFNAYIISFPIS